MFELASSQHYRRIYHYHIRKTGGTSLNAAFWNLANLDLRSFRDRTAISAHGLTFVRHELNLIERGQYFYAHSHRPAHMLSLPPETFTITILRDPLARLISYYKYLLWAVTDASARENEPDLAAIIRNEGYLVGRSFDEFLVNIPKPHLCRQLFMFSKNYDVDEALTRISRCSFVGFTERFGSTILQLSTRLALPLVEKHERRSILSPKLSTVQLEKARHLLASELSFVNKVKALTPASI